MEDRHRLQYPDFAGKGLRVLSASLTAIVGFLIGCVLLPVVASLLGASGLALVVGMMYLWVVWLAFGLYCGWLLCILQYRWAEEKSTAHHLLYCCLLLAACVAALWAALSNTYEASASQEMHPFY